MCLRSNFVKILQHDAEDEISKVILNLNDDQIDKIYIKSDGNKYKTFKVKKI